MFDPTETIPLMAGLTPGGLSEPSYRVDALTGAGNLLSFTDWLVTRLKPETPLAWSLLVLDVNHLSRLNRTRGRGVGDQVLRWVSLLAKDESRATVYRIGNDEFAVPLNGRTADACFEVARRVFDRLNREAAGQSVTPLVVTTSVVHYGEGEHVEPSDVFGYMAACLRYVKTEHERGLHGVPATELSGVDPSRDLRWMMELFIHRILDLGEMLEESQQQALSDPLTGLPNSRAVEQGLGGALRHAAAMGRPMAILMMDGDGLKAYNEISYAAGDVMIRNLGETLQANLRPGDSLARWRVGDEFLAILPGIGIAQAVEVGERVRNAVQASSQTWPRPVTISIGVASYPEHGDKMDALLAHAERGLNEAKASGKNRVIVAVEST